MFRLRAGGFAYGLFATSACTRSLRMTIGFASSPTILIAGDVTSVPATVTVAPISTTVSSHLDVLVFASSKPSTSTGRQT
jgi:hypothetical protein